MTHCIPGKGDSRGKTDQNGREKWCLLFFFVTDPVCMELSRLYAFVNSIKESSPCLCDLCELISRIRGIFVCLFHSELIVPGGGIVQTRGGLGGRGREL